MMPSVIRGTWRKARDALLNCARPCLRRCPASILPDDSLLLLLSSHILDLNETLVCNNPTMQTQLTARRSVLSTLRCLRFFGLAPRKSSFALLVKFEDWLRPLAPHPSCSDQLQRRTTLKRQILASLVSRAGSPLLHRKSRFVSGIACSASGDRWELVQHLTTTLWEIKLPPTLEARAAACSHGNEMAVKASWTLSWSRTKRRTRCGPAKEAVDLQNRLAPIRGLRRCKTVAERDQKRAV